MSDELLMAVLTFSDTTPFYCGDHPESLCAVKRFAGELIRLE
jgi:hypothetical protein